MFIVASLTYLDDIYPPNQTHYQFYSQDEVDLETTLTAPTSLLAFNTEQWRP